MAFVVTSIYGNLMTYPPTVIDTLLLATTAYIPFLQLYPLTPLREEHIILILMIISFVQHYLYHFLLVVVAMSWMIMVVTSHHPS